MADPNHEEHEALLTWIGGAFDPDHFSPGEMIFWDPRKRWRKAFEESGELM